jgi:transposase-like protein/IS1 family transposase
VSVSSCPKYLIKVSKNQVQSIASILDFGILKSSEQEKPGASANWHRAKRNQAFAQSRLSNLIVARAATEGDSKMIAIAVTCNHEKTRKNGKDHLGNERTRCCDCGKSWIVKADRTLGDMRIPKEKAIMALRMMLEGNSLWSIHRLTGLSRHTLNDLLLYVGKKCVKFWDARMKDIPVNDVQCDELWSFIGCKEKTRRALKRDECFGDSYTFLAIERDTKLVLTYYTGKRSPISTQIFLQKLADSVKDGFQITTDGYGPYHALVPSMLWQKKIDFAMLIKIFGNERTGPARYSPAPIIGTIRKHICGSPDMDRVCTSHCERLNLSVRMSIRRMTRLTNGFSKSPVQHEAAMVLWLVYYNFCRVHTAHKMTPAVMAGIATETWSVETLLNELAPL